MTHPAGDSDSAQTTANSTSGFLDKERDQEESNLLDLIDQYEALQDGSPQRSEIRLRFLDLLKVAPPEVADIRISDFLTEEVRSSDLDLMAWEKADDVLAFGETLYNFEFQDELREQRVQGQILSLLNSALHQFESSGDFDKMIRLLTLTPGSLKLADSELMRMRSRVYLYEMRHVARRRRILFAYLGLQVLIILVIFPLLFVQAENVARASLIGDSYPILSFMDGLYWSIITAASIGYGDVTPMTSAGRIMASLLGLFGVVTIGIIAGLVLQWITPRRF